MEPFVFAPGQERMIPLEDLAAFYAHPCQSIARRRLKLFAPKLEWDSLADEDALEFAPSTSLLCENVLNHEKLMKESKLVPRLREEGFSLSEEEFLEYGFRQIISSMLVEKIDIR